MSKHAESAAQLPVEPLLRVDDVARIIRRGRPYVYELVRAGELHPVRVGARLRFSTEDVRDYLRRLGLSVHREGGGASESHEL